MILQDIKAIDWPAVTAQLDSAGWKPMNNDASSVAGTWTNATNGQEVTITVTKVPIQAGCYDISLRATARQSTK